jgi:hypothetical protein
VYIDHDGRAFNPITERYDGVPESRVARVVELGSMDDLVAAVTTAAE